MQQQLTDARRELAELRERYEVASDLNDEFYDVLRKWGIVEPVLERYKILRGI